MPTSEQHNSETIFFIFSQECSSAFADQISTSLSQDQKILSPSNDQASASPADETASLPSADQRSLSPSDNERTPCQYDQTFTSSFTDEKALSPSVDQISYCPSDDQISASSSMDEISSSPSDDQRFLSPSGDGITPCQYDQTFTSSFTDQKALSPSVHQTSSCPSDGHISASSSVDETSSSPSADQRFLSPLGDQIIPWQYDQTSTPLSADQKSPSPSVELTFPSPSADQKIRSPAADQNSPSLSFDQTSSSRNADQMSTVSYANQTCTDQRFSSFSADQTSFSLSGNRTSRFATTNQTSLWPSSLQRFPSSCTDQTYPAKQKDSLSPSNDQTNFFSLFPDQECLSWTFPDWESSSFADQEGSTSLFGSLFNPFSDTIFDSRPNVETNCVFRPAMETIDEFPQPNVSSPPCTMPSWSSECHTRSSVPTNADTTFPMLNGSPRHSSIRQATTSLGVTVSAAMRPLMSCEIRPPTHPSLMGIQTTTPEPGSNVNIDDNRFRTSAGYFEFMPSNISASRTYGKITSVPGSDSRFPTPIGRHIPASNFTASETYGNTSCIPGSIPVTALMTSCDVRPPGTPSLMCVDTTPRGPSSNVNFDSRFPTPTVYSTPSSTSITYGNTFCEPTSVFTSPLTSCDVRSPVIPSLMSIQTTPPMPSSNVNFDSRFSRPIGHSTPRSASRTYGNTYCEPKSIPTSPMTSCNVRSPVIPSLMGIQTTPPMPSSNVTFDNMFATTTGYSMPSGASKTYENTFCEPKSVPTSPMTSCDVKSPVIPSLMSTQTTPPMPSSNVNFDSPLPTPTGYSTPSSASRTYGNTFCEPKSVSTSPLTSCDVKSPVIPSLMSIQTTPPVHSFPFIFDTWFPKPTRHSTPSRASRTYGNTCCASGSVSTRPLMSRDVRPPVTPSLMSIQNSPPVPCNNFRPLRNNLNRGVVSDPIATTIPSLMSNETRPPWEPRVPHTPGLG